ncbi:maleylpyruvate isomerase [Spinactinospora alkalitolerans]|uniref:Maleylpyruvate isomerase n=1 Tax=Spinactinospora alkalitolerans TaxID=687207 RepID=A0A852U6K8_9ACTN|nr:maleylpyruvate isomerase family mycothiol-dependent enzyme [Spinactinospora alkalitolerans]NYE49550.1 maleylpyruvate isomerase [Spinactinospora alkalitolerans]
MTERERTQIHDWLEQGTELLAEHVAELPDVDFRGPSRLPGWTRAHVIAHLVGNAGALMNMVTWARTGVETRMYASREARDAAIEEGSQDPPEWLRAEFTDSARRLEEALDELPEEALSARLFHPKRGAFPASDLPWLRTVEVWLHLVDLNVGRTCADLPADLVDALLERTCADLTAAGEAPALRLVATDRDAATWTVGEAPAAVEVIGPASDLLGWLTGRDPGARLRTGTDEDLPGLPAWL